MEVIVPVRLTEEDVTKSMGEFHDSLKHRKSITRKCKLIIVVFFYILLLVYITSFVNIFDIQTNEISISKIIYLSALFLCCFSILVYFSRPLKKTEQEITKNKIVAFHQEYNLQLLHIYVFSAVGINDESSTEHSFIAWDDIYYLTEFASCFAIEISTTKKFIIPRRCFESEQQLRDFRSIVSTNIPISKWSLKGFPLGYSKPDAKTDALSDALIPLPDKTDSIYSIVYQLDEKEALNLNISMLLHSKRFKKKFVFLALLFVVNICFFKYDPILWGVCILFEIFLIYSMIISFKDASHKSFRTDKHIGKVVSISFFSDRIFVVNETSYSQCFWNTIWRIQKTNAGLLFYLQPGLAVILPASALNRMPNKQAFLAFIKSRKLASRK